MPLTDLWRPIDGGSLRADTQLTRVRAEPHCPAHVGDVLLAFHQRDHGVVALRSELTRMTVGETDHVARELDDRGLHPEADTKEWQAGFSSIADCLEHALDPTNA